MQTEGNVMAPTQDKRFCGGGPPGPMFFKTANSPDQTQIYHLVSFPSNMHCSAIAVSTVNFKTRTG
jgi:hypothetical protein